MNIYCGNNALHDDIVINGKVIGNRYQCLRKGIGSGLNMPLDISYAGEYVPIDDTKIYCGNQDILPEGYNRLGNNPQCLQKGVAIGKRTKALRGGTTISFLKDNIFILFYIVVEILFFIIMYYIKPSFLTKVIYDQSNNTPTPTIVIDWTKFIFFFISISLVLYLIFIVYRKNIWIRIKG